MKNRAELMLIDRSRLLREGLKRMLSGSNLLVIQECVDAAEALQRDFGDWEPAIIMLDWGRQEGNRRRLIEELLQRWPEAKVVVFDDSLRKPDMVMALRSGASAYLLKSMSLEALVPSLWLVLAGEVVLPTELAAQLVREPPGAADAGDLLEELDVSLSPREVQILRCLIAGQANKWIARELDITEGTVKVHIKGLLKKIRAQNRTQAAIWALSSGLQQTSAA